MYNPIDILIEWLKDEEAVDHESLEKARKYCKKEIDVKTVYLCLNCEVSLTYKQMMGYNGICPHCNAKSKGDIVDTIKVYVEIPEKKKLWWKLW